jgi:uncharacterized membrane protein YhaH (DUF805 family)
MAKKRTHFLVEGLFGFDGRMRRSEFWLLSIGLGVINFVLTAVLAGLMGQDLMQARGSGIGVITALLFLWPTLALTAKRGHDRNRPTAYSVVLLVGMNAVAYASSFLSAFGQQLLGGVLLLLWMALVIYFFVDYGCLDGTKGRNRYGLSPKGLKGAGDEDVSQAFA